MCLNEHGFYPENLGRPAAPINWPRGWVLHHMLDWLEVRDFWNVIVTARARPELLRYMTIIDYGDSYTREQMADAIVAGDITPLGIGARDTLAECVCWQGYNIFQGPSVGARRPHAPDPHRLLDQHVEGATTFDFPVVAPPHGQRANTLWRVFQELQGVVGAAPGQPLALGPIHAVCQLLEEMQGLDLILIHEVNWFAVSKQRFWSMSEFQRQTFFQECYRIGIMEADGDAVYEALFGA